MLGPTCGICSLVALLPRSFSPPRQGTTAVEIRQLRKEAWQAMERAVGEGKLRNIGVSNYGVKHLRGLLAYAKIKPAVNQIEWHPYLQQRDVQEYCRHHGIIIEAYGSINSGVETRLLDDRVVHEVAAHYPGVSVAQVLLRHALQHDHIILPKTVSLKRLRENSLAGVDFELTTVDMATLDALDKGERSYWGSDHVP